MAAELTRSEKINVIARVAIDGNEAELIARCQEWGVLSLRPMDSECVGARVDDDDHFSLRRPASTTSSIS